MPQAMIGLTGKDLEAFKDVIRKLREFGAHPSEHIDELREIWKNWGPNSEKYKKMPPNQQQELESIFLDAIGKLPRDEQKKIIEKKYGVGGNEVEEQSITSFPESVAYKVQAELGGPPSVYLGTALASTIGKENEAEMQNLMGYGILNEVKYGRGSNQARKVGREIANKIEEYAKDNNVNLYDKLGPKYNDLLAMLREGRVLEAIKGWNLVKDLGKTIRELEVKKPLMIFNLGGETPRLSLGKLGNLGLFVNGVASIDMLISQYLKVDRKDFEQNYDQTGRIILVPTGETRADLVLKVGPAGTIQFKPGMELIFTPSVVVPVGLQTGILGNFKLEFKDVSGTTIDLGNHPIYYGFLAEYQTDGTLKYKADLGVMLYNSGKFLILALIDWLHYLEESKLIKRPSYTVSPGLKFKRNEHEFDVRGTVGDKTIGGGVEYTYRKLLTVGVELGQTEKEVINQVGKKSGIYGGFYVKINLEKEEDK